MDLVKKYVTKKQVCILTLNITGESIPKNLSGKTAYRFIAHEITRLFEIKSLFIR